MELVVLCLLGEVYMKYVYQLVTQSSRVFVLLMNHLVRMLTCPNKV
jgi:hypothetical protein